MAVFLGVFGVGEGDTVALTLTLSQNGRGDMQTDPVIVAVMGLW